MGLVSIHRNFCARCGGIIDDPKSIARGYGPACWRKMKLKEIKPYIEQVPFVDTGGIDYMAKIYGEFENWEDSF